MKDKMKKIYTIVAIAHKKDDHIISEVTEPTTITQARKNILKASDLLRKNGYENATIVLLKNGKIAFPKLNQDLKKITNTATGKTLWQEIQH